MKRLLAIQILILFYHFGYTQTIFEINGPESVCSGQSVTITYTNCTGSVLWFNGASTSSITIQPTKTITTYATCTVNNIETISSHTVIVTPEIELASNTGQCFEPGKTVLTVQNAPQNSQFKWRRDNVEIPNAKNGTFNPTEIGNYTAELVHEGEWVFQHPLPDGYNLNGIDYRNGVGIAVGDRGTILRTTDNGQSWNQIESQSIYKFSDVHFVTNDIVWIVGQYTIIRSIDAGLTWQTVETGNNIWYEIPKVQFVDVNNGWILIGSNYTGRVIRTTDGGDTWTEHSTNMPNVSSLDMYFVNNNVGYISALNGNMRKTIDGGISWSTVSTGYNESIIKVQFLTENEGWAITWNRILKTTDGGINWSQSGNQNYFRNVLFTSNLNGWALLVHGGINYTSDGGFTWQYKSEQKNLTELLVDSNSKIQVVGEGGRIFTSIDNGSNWLKERGGNLNEIRDFDFVNTQTGYAVGDYGKVLKTTNSGKSWETKSLPNNYEGKFIDFVDVNTGWVLLNATEVYKTTDGGQSWITQNLSDYGSYRNIRFFDTQNGLIVTTGPVVYKIKKTTNGGSTWTDVSIPANTYNFFFQSMTTGWAGGGNGLIYKTTNGGISWQQINLNTTDFIAKIFFVNQNLGFINGFNNHWRTTDGGNSWQPIQFLSNFNWVSPISYSFINDQIGYAISQSNLNNNTDRGLLVTRDAGLTWELKAVPTYNYPLKNIFLSENQGYLLASPTQLLMFKKLNQTCQSNTITLNAPPPTPIITSNQTGDYICGNQTISLTETACLSPNLLVWEDGSNLNTKSLTVTNSKNIYATCMDNAGCKTTNIFEIKHSSVPLITKSLSEPFCSDQGLKLSYQGVQNQSYEWFKDEISLGTSNTVLANQTGVYTLKNNNTVLYTLQNPLPTDEQFRNVFLFGNNGIAISYNGLYKSTDAGEHWGKINNTQNYSDAYFFDKDNGMIVSQYSSQILRTSDGGITFQNINLPVFSNWQKLYFTSNDVGYLIGQNYILKTSNGGTTWNISSNGVPTNTYWQRASFLSDLSGWVCGSHGQIIKTTDGGNTWTSLNTGVSVFLIDIVFIDNNNGFCLTENSNNNQLLRTTDGGQNWSLNTIANYKYFNTIFFNSNLTGFIVGQSGSYKTLDGGNTWNPVVIDNIASYIRGAKFIDSNIGFMYGSGGKILKTSDSGITWNIHGEGLFGSFNAIHFPSENTGYVVGDFGFIAKTNNGGKNWNKINSPDNGQVSNVWFTSESTGFITVSGYRIYKTVDGGNSWSLKLTQNGSNKLFFLDENIGWTVGYQGVVMKTSNAGENWVVQTFPNTTFLKDIYFTDPNNGWIVGQGGATYKTSNGGNTWTQMGSAGSQDLNSVRFIDINIGFTGSNSNFYKTNDGGITWTVDASFNAAISFSNAQSIEVFNANQLVVTSYGDIIKSPNGGQTWERFSVNSSVFKSSFVNFNKGWIIKNYESIYKYEVGSVPCSSDVIEVVPNTTKPIISTTNSQVVCEGSSISLTATNCNANIRWSTGETGQTINVIPNRSQNYFAICENEAGCRMIDSKGLAVSSKPVLIPEIVAPCQTLQLKAENTPPNMPLEWQQNNTFFNPVVQTINYNTNYINSTELGEYKVKQVQPALWIPFSNKINQGSITDIAMVSIDTLIAVTYAGEILKSVDGGENWVHKNSKTYEALSDVFVVNSQVILIGGKVLLKSTDGGESWSQIGNENFSYLNEIYFTDENNGWLIDLFKVQKTVDGGLNWVTVFTHPNYYNFFDLKILGNKILINDPLGTIYSSLDSGITWNSQSVSPNFSSNKMDFIDQNTGWIYGYGNAFKTIDGGVTWSLFELPFSYSSIIDFNAFDAYNLQVLRGSEIFNSEDGGLTWTSKYLNPSTYGGFQNIFPLNEAKSIIYGTDMVIAKENGKSFRNINWFGSNIVNISKLVFTDVTTGYSTFNNTVLKTTDGGKNWTMVYTGFYPNGIYFSSQNTGWIFGNSQTILKSSDAGSSWNSITTPIGSGGANAFNDIIFTSSNTGWLVGSNGLVLKTIDGGQNWIQQTLPTTQSLNKISFSGNLGCIVGNNGTVLVSNDAGATWALKSTITSNSIQDVQVVGPSTIYISGPGNNTIFKSSDSGQSWTQLIVNGSIYTSISKIKFFDGNKGWALANDKIYYTQDAGHTWKASYLNGGSGYTLFFLNESTGWVAGNGLYKMASAISCGYSDPYIFNSAITHLTNPENNIINNPVTGKTSIEANSSFGKITASNYVLNNGTKAEYKASSVELLPGFKAETGTIFSAEVGGCSN